MSELREECYKCLNNQSCPNCADYGSIICMTKRKFKMPKNEEDSIYAIKFATMQQQINEKEKRIQELEEKLKHRTDNTAKLIEVTNLYLNSIPKQKVKDLKESIILDNTIVGGRRNAKTLEYGIKLGKIKVCEELLEGEK